MFTICPKCSLKLSVTAADLRVAQGYVRCGRCANVFNALAGLTDEQQAALAQQERAAAAALVAPSPPPATSPRVTASPPAASPPSATQPSAPLPPASKPAAPQPAASPAPAPRAPAPQREAAQSAGAPTAPPRAPVTPQPPAAAKAPGAPAAAKPALAQPGAAPSIAPASARAPPSAPRAAPAPSPAVRPASPPAAPARTAPAGSAAAPSGPAASISPARAAAPPGGAPPNTAAPAARPLAPARGAATGTAPAPTPAPAPASVAAPVRNAQPRADQSSSPAAQPRAGAAAQPAKPASPEDDELESALLEFDPTSTDVSAVFVQAQTVSGEPSGTFETIILSSEDAESEESSREQSGRELAETDEVEAAFEFELDDATALEPPPPARPPTARSAGPARESEPPSLEAPEDSEADAVAAAQLEPPVRAITGSQRLSGAMGALFGADSAPGVPPWASANRVLLGLCAALAVLLGIQVLHHFRSDLAEGSFLSRPLAAVYGALGMPITPRWDVSAYEVRQLGAFAGPKGSNALTVRASIKNTGQRAQPLPLLRITVQDRFGNRVAARDVPPSAYRVGAQRDLAPGQRVDAEIAFVDPGANVVGFDIDACLLEGASRIVCSNDLSALR